MLIVVVGLTSISFSYYIEDTSDANQLMKINKIDTFIQSDDIDSDEITLPAQTSKTININVINNNSFPNIYKLYYVGNDVTVISDKDVQDTIDSMEVHAYSLKLNNPTDEIRVVKLGIKNGYVGSQIEVDGIEIK
jgi:hypothetical protein